MNDEPNLEKDPALYFRWRWVSRSAPPSAVPSAMALAAYADGKSPEAEQEAMELAIAEHPGLLSDLMAARGDMTEAVPSADFLARACQLVPLSGDAGQAEIVSLAAMRARNKSAPAQSARVEFQGLMAWGALAASILVVSMLGFDLGEAAQQSIEQTIPSAAPVDLLEQADQAVG